MKRHIFFFLLVISTSACTKSKKNTTCYECEMKYANDVSAGKQYPCTEDIEKWQKEIKDNTGRPMQSACKPI